MFADTTHKYYREQYFDIASAEEGASALASTSKAGVRDTDRPLIVQFCANSPEHLLTAAKLVQDHCDAVDINLGCPQEIARRGHYGAFLMEEWDLVYNMSPVNTLHKNLSVPVTAKFRVFDDVERTVAYAQMLERAGAQILTCHGRTREQRGQNSGLASYAHIRAVRAAVRVPLIANGNILFSSDVARCLKETGCDAVMSAEGVLYNPALFNGLQPSPGETDLELTLDITNPPLAPLALEYLDIVRSQRTRTSPSAVKGHLFKILRPALAQPKHHDLREKLGRVKVDAPRRVAEGEQWVWVDEYVRICEELAARLEADAKDLTKDGTIPLRELITKDAAMGLDVLPYWLSQPYFRPLKSPVAKKDKAGKQGKAKETAATAGAGAAVLEEAEKGLDLPVKRPSCATEANDGDEVEAKRVKLDVAAAVAA
ncbi:hypothetical protein DXG03_006677 [Asterophora parasitica]|uniref:tRNA-dihydrouridine(16/17) synthase [NAD(P)(+)] n=1 Tax=Asterophora parasitica TaxID=117018 RepID=A0A9P7G122_9AGAR|nr:hypothetical protein DXG03_006677 [Asterophora parasitica]